MSAVQGGGGQDWKAIGGQTVKKLWDARENSKTDPTLKLEMGKLAGRMVQLLTQPNPTDQKIMALCKEALGLLEANQMLMEAKGQAPTGGLEKRTGDSGKPELRGDINVKQRNLKAEDKKRDKKFRRTDKYWKAADKSDARAEETAEKGALGKLRRGPVDAAANANAAFRRAMAPKDKD